MAIASSSSAYHSLLTRPPSHNRHHFSPPSFSFSSPRQINGFSSLSFHPTKTPSPLRLVSMRRQSKATVVTGQSWEASIMDSKTPVLVEFYASWCGPCQMVHRVIDEIAGEYGGRLKCFVLNADQDPQITEEYEIKAVPIVLLFKNGQQLESVVGTMPKEFYVAAIERVLSSSS
ncbi:thioredoxin M3, chloroplastic-like [Cynara cardunculus var. scolymus]|uniref:Thioredoxin n=1 Tax=Cynara cardunculus var. scolymus TaxID=59895 RepID=A0A103YKE9_CYNCS|nr:thioredoxin M3, chloroplastic-like [Cynara cardunculus var. scolymus]KVI10789.1 Thioredoxin [Cynara cardunculus var. scolymus]